MVEIRLSLQDISLRQKVIHYVLDRKCLSGGFCFYKLEEPNGSDTWNALSILDLLRVRFEDEATIAYLRGTQHPTAPSKASMRRTMRSRALPFWAKNLPSTRGLM